MDDQLRLIEVESSAGPRGRGLRPARAGEVVVTVLPAEAGIDKVFDYRMPAGSEPPPLGTIVAVPLGERTVRGWVLAVATQERAPLPAALPLASIDRVIGAGPPSEVIDLARWVAEQWVARTSTILRAASPERRVPVNTNRGPGTGRGESSEAPTPGLEPWLAEMLNGVGTDGVTTLALPPLVSLATVLGCLAQRGPMIVVTPSVRRSRSAHRALRRQGVACALFDEDWDRCRFVTAIGQRSAVFAPLGDARLVVVVDEHDERLTAEGSPTWNAREVAIERARRAGVPCVLISATPSVDAVHFGGLHRPPRGPERAGWPLIEVIDTAEIDPRERQFPAALIRALRDADRAAVIAERLGQARVAVCTGCRLTANCERCGAALNRPVPGSFRCTRCDLERPVICSACGQTKFKNLLLGAQRIAEELPAALGEPVGLVTARHRGDLPGERVLVGTEALLHRLSRAAVVAFVDFDSMLLAPRYRAHERLLGSMAHAARLVGAASSAPRPQEATPPGRLVLCTRNVGHPLVAALTARRPVDVVGSESQVRRTLRLPPFGSLARIGGPAGAAFVASIPADAAVEVRPHREDWLVRAEDRAHLVSALGPLDRPAGRLRLQVDPYDV